MSTIFNSWIASDIPMETSIGLNPRSDSPTVAALLGCSACSPGCCQSNVWPFLRKKDTNEKFKMFRNIAKAFLAVHGVLCHPETMDIEGFTPARGSQAVKPNVPIGRYNKQNTEKINKRNALNYLHATKSIKCVYHHFL